VAKKKVAKTTKKAATKKAATKKVTTKKAVTKKTSSAKKTSKKAPVAKKAPAAKKTSKKAPVAKKAPAAKKTTKKTAKTTTKATSKKAASGKKTTKKAGSDKEKKAPRRKIDFANPKSVAAAAVTSEVDAQGYVFINGRRVRAISTKGMELKKKSKTSRATVAVEEVKAAPDVSRIKTKMLKKELDAYKDLLLEKRRQIVGMVSGLESEALRSNGGNLSNMPIHMADVGSDVFEQDFTLGMAETERALLVEIDAALIRIKDKTYGVCQASGKPIPKTRLKAKPWAKYTIEAARVHERSTASE
jgi:RNA polymerase-binding transcription factor DksA